MALEVGQQAPDFTLVDEANEQVTLSALRGSPVVLVFYPFDFSGTCTAEHCEIRDDFGGWQAKGAQVFGISRDSRFSHAAFKQQEEFTHRLLADLKGAVATEYGCWNEAAASADRATFVVDREGKVALALYNGRDRRDHRSVEDCIS
ncbi:MAG: peroxiredoxin [Dehalococcoidia bacterium]